jgi:hypothetical protein
MCCIIRDFQSGAASWIAAVVVAAMMFIPVHKAECPGLTQQMPLLLHQQ